MYIAGAVRANIVVNSVNNTRSPAMIMEYAPEFPNPPSRDSQSRLHDDEIRYEASSRTCKCFKYTKKSQDKQQDVMPPYLDRRSGGLVTVHRMVTSYEPYRCVLANIR